MFGILSYNSIVLCSHMRYWQASPNTMVGRPSTRCWILWDSTGQNGAASLPTNYVLQSISSFHYPKKGSSYFLLEPPSFLNLAKTPLLACLCLL